MTANTSGSENSKPHGNGTAAQAGDSVGMEPGSIDAAILAKFTIAEIGTLAKNLRTVRDIVNSFAADADGLHRAGLKHSDAELYLDVLSQQLRESIECLVAEAKARKPEAHDEARRRGFILLTHEVAEHDDLIGVAVLAAEAAGAEAQAVFSECASLKRNSGARSGH
jgi:hypothetical protein